jgi:Asp/Glu/hydantoin racemase
MDKTVKIGIVYTSTTPELIETVNQEIHKNLGGSPQLMNYQDPSILAEVRENGYVTAGAAARLVSLFMQAVSDGADAILNCCSSVGEVADAVQDLARYTGIPIVRIDEEMCREAVRTGSRVGVLATLATTLVPTKNTILRAAREMNRRVVLADGLIDGAFGIDQDTFKKMLCDKAMELQDETDVILLAQGSMAYAEDAIRDKTGKPVLSSPRFGAVALKEALKAKGLC